MKVNILVKFIKEIRELFPKHIDQWQSIQTVPNNTALTDTLSSVNPEILKA